MQILYLDDHLAAVYKPAGWLVHRSDIDRHETRIAMRELRDQLARHVYPVHRLDKPTAGALLFALDAETARLMTQRFAAGEVRKRYLAVVRGHVPDTAVIDYPLVEELDATTDRQARRGKSAQMAVTEYRCLKRVELPYASAHHPSSRFSLVQAVPKTGRKHQIRRHMKHVFHPVVGDTTHGDGRQNRLFREHLHSARLMLAALGMSFAHPHTRQPLDIACEPDADFQRVMFMLGWAGNFDAMKI